MTWEEINTALAERVKEAKASVNAEGLSPEDRQKAENEALASELRNMDHSVRQFLHDGGHQQATAQNAQKLEAAEEAKNELKKAKKALEDEKTALEERITELEEKAPEVADLRKTLQAEFKEREDALEAKIAEAEQKVTDLEDARKQDKVDGFENRLRAHIAPRVTEEGEEWMRNRVDRMRLDGRFLPKNGEGLAVGVRRPGSDELEYHASSEDELLTVVATEVLEDAPKWAVKSNVAGGGGATGGSSKGGASKWDKIRETTKSRGAKPEEVESVKKRRSALMGEDS